MKYMLMKIIAMIFLIGIAVGGLMIPKDVTRYTREPFQVLDGGWTQIKGDQAINLDHASEYEHCETSEPIVLERTITEDMVEKCFVFYAQHQDVQIFIDDEEVYHLFCPDYLDYWGSPGCSWVNIYIPEDAQGKSLRLSLQSELEIYHGLPTTFYSIHSGELYSVQMDYSWLRNITSMIVLFIAIISYVNASLWKVKKMRHFLYALADFYLFVGLWLCAETDMLSMWLGRSILSSILAMIFIRIIPIAFYHFFMAMLPYQSWRTKMMAILVWGNFVASVLIQLIFGISMYQLLIVQLHVLIGLSSLVIVELICYYKSRKKRGEYDVVLYSVILILATIYVEYFIYRNHLIYGAWLGVPIVIACVGYAFIAHIFMVRTESETKTTKTELEHAYNNLHKQPLKEQINAHFLYNSLNTVSSYCKTDPALADKTVQLLAKYLRFYSRMVGEKDYVALEEELVLVQYYMKVQNMRFDHRIKLHIETDCDEVRVPPLTIQPLVENAINHGLRDHRYNGDITICAKRKCDMVEISVSDNGTGFHMNEFERRKGIGLRNIEARIKAMDGCMVVKSKKEKGTKVILSIPYIK